MAFSMYSRIPMPRFDWESEDMKYHLIFFPWVGMVIAALEYLWRMLGDKFNIEVVAFVAVSIAIPLIVTGGFHVDGFMDTSDALSSWQDKEKRLEILKDPHIGAFAVIRLVIAILILAASLSVMDFKCFKVWLFSFFLSRVLSGISVVRFKNAKKDGLLNTESKTAGKNAVFGWLLAEGILGAVLMIITSPVVGALSLTTLLVCFFYYKKMAMDKFGGITGDLAGWFVCVSEVWCSVVCGIGALWYL